MDKRLLNLLQAGVSLVSEPFAALADALDTTAEDVLARTRALKQADVIRQIGAIFDSRRLGYESTLVAVEVPQGRIDQAAEVFGAHPGVSHCYSREFMSTFDSATPISGEVPTIIYNLWLTLTVPPGVPIEETLSRLAALASIDNYLVLPAEKVFKISMKLDLVGDNAALNQGHRFVSPNEASLERQLPTEKDKAIIRELQRDLDIMPRPFHIMAERLQMSVEELLAKAREYMDTGTMRRFSAVLRHRRAGFAVNGMACWDVPAEQVENFGTFAAHSPEVSHCYQRPAYPPSWPYNLFTMIHGRTQVDVEGVVESIAEHTGITNHVILRSVKEYKKERVKYFEEVVE